MTLSGMILNIGVPLKDGVIFSNAAIELGVYNQTPVLWHNDPERVVGRMNVRRQVGKTYNELYGRFEPNEPKIKQALFTSKMQLKFVPILEDVLYSSDNPTVVVHAKVVAIGLYSNAPGFILDQLPEQTFLLK